MSIIEDFLMYACVPVPCINPTAETGDNKARWSFSINTPVFIITAIAARTLYKGIQSYRRAETPIQSFKSLVKMYLSTTVIIAGIPFIPLCELAPFCEQGKG
ncbi:MAG: hypothetical protein ACRDFB_05725, partial [Rhabdochlamydiaceae bacterium]